MMVETGMQIGVLVLGRAVFAEGITMRSAYRKYLLEAIYNIEYHIVTFYGRE